MPYWVSSPTAGTSGITPTMIVADGNRTWVTTSTTATTTPIWYNAPSLATPYVRPPTDQQLYEKAVREHDTQEAARIQARIDARRAATEERDRVAAAEREQQNAAKARAMELLLQHLTPAQQETYRINDWFIVEGGRSKTKYKIHGAHLTANIDVLDNQNKKTHRLCGHAPMHQIPIADNLLAQKLMLECDEDAFLRIANRHLG